MPDGGPYFGCETCGQIFIEEETAEHIGHRFTWARPTWQGHVVLFWRRVLRRFR